MCGCSDPGLQSQIYAGHHPTRSRNCARTPPPFRARLAASPITLSLWLCLLAPPLRSRRSPKFPSPQPPSSLLLLLRFRIHPSILGRWSLQPHLHLQIGHSEPCYFDVPGDAPSTLTEFAGVVQDSRGLRRLGGSGCDHRLRQTQTQRREEGRGQRVPRQRTRLAQAVTGGHSA
jgi:hypothetical protein